MDDSEEGDMAVERSGWFSSANANSTAVMSSSQEPAVVSYVTHDMVSFSSTAFALSKERFKISQSSANFNR